jgi:hypothetical protein
MIRILIAVVALAVTIQAAVPQNLDVIKERKATMKQNGAAAGAAAKMLKGEAPFDLAVAQASLKTFIDVAAKMPALFPDDAKPAAKRTPCRRSGTTKPMSTPALRSSDRMRPTPWPLSRIRRALPPTFPPFSRIAAVAMRNIAQV